MPLFVQYDKFLGETRGQAYQPIFVDTTVCNDGMHDCRRSSCDAHPCIHDLNTGPRRPVTNEKPACERDKASAYRNYVSHDMPPSSALMRTPSELLPLYRPQSLQNSRKLMPQRVQSAAPYVRHPVHLQRPARSLEWMMTMP